MTKKDIVRQISEKIGETQLNTKKIVQETFDAIVDTLMETGRIELRKFGVFMVKQRKARKARNPQTGDAVEVPPKFVVTFKPGRIMEERVKELKSLPVTKKPRARRKPKNLKTPVPGDPEQNNASSG
ncbi:MAG: HU family DNA-binding protein [Gemmataceae bacterium]